MSIRTLAPCLAVAAAMAQLTAQNDALQVTTNVDGGVAYAFDPRMVPPTGITVEAWVTYDDTTIPTGATTFFWPTIARQNISPNQESWNFRVSAANTGQRNLQFILRSSNGQLYSTSYLFAVGEFQAATHLAATFDGTTIRLFKNGAPVGTPTTLASLTEIQNNGGVLRIGNGDPAAPGRESWNGTIDEVRVWPMARSAAEILASKDQEISGMPGGVLHFPFNGSYDCEDPSVVATPFGTTALVAGTAPLTPLVAAMVQVGVPSSTCVRKPQIAAGSLATLGNTAFAFWCVRGPRPANSPAAVVFAANAAAPSGQPSVLGIDLAFDLTTIAASAVLAPPTNALGNAFFPLPIPQQSSLLGIGFVFQFGFLDATCGAQGLTASDGLAFSIQ